MWGDLDFSRLHITVELGNCLITVLNAKRMIFHESFPDHRHGFFELHYIFGGKGTLLCEGQCYPLHERMVYLNGPNVNHEQITDPSDVMMEYSFSFDVQQKSSKKSKKETRKLTDTLSDVRLWIGDDRTDILAIFREMENEIHNKEAGYFDVLRSLCELLIIKLIRNFSDAPHIEAESHPLPVEDRRKFIMDEAFIYDYRDMTLPALAKLLNLSERQTMRNIRQYYGVSFSEFRQSSRINAAARLLREYELVYVSQISEMVGFSSEAHFRKLFKEKYGVTPREYRIKQTRSDS